MPIFYPADRRNFLRSFEPELFPQLPFHGRKTKELESMLKRRSTTGLVLILFKYAPYSKEFRWRVNWWKKLNFKFGISEQGASVEVPPTALVGVYLKDLSDLEREKIIE